MSDIRGGLMSDIRGGLIPAILRLEFDLGMEVRTPPPTVHLPYRGRRPNLGRSTKLVGDLMSDAQKKAPKIPPYPKSPKILETTGLEGGNQVQIPRTPLTLPLPLIFLLHF